MKREHRHAKDNRVLAFALGAVLLIFVMNAAADRLGQSGREEQKEAIEQALDRDITACYALEGAYPPDVQYLEDHYGLTYDKSAFRIDYRPVASNLRPDYTVIETGGTQ